MDVFRCNRAKIELDIDMELFWAPTHQTSVYSVILGDEVMEAWFT